MIRYLRGRAFLLLLTAARPAAAQNVDPWANFGAALTSGKAASDTIAARDLVLHSAMACGNEFAFARANSLSSRFGKKGFKDDKDAAQWPVTLLIGKAAWLDDPGKARLAGDATATSAIRQKLVSARIIASDETTTRTNGVIQWQWVFISNQAVLHKVAPSRARRVAEEVLGDHRPDVWVSDRYAGQQELARVHLVCLAHVLRDVQYAIDCGDTIFAPTIRDHYDGRSGSVDADTNLRTAPWRVMRPGRISRCPS